jgi:2-dehydro-3-deoxygluconokinase
MTEVVTLGEALVGLAADRAAPLADVALFRRYVAGAEANVAVGLARLGRGVAFVGRVGADGFGTAIERRLRAEGVDTAGLTIDPDAATGILVRERRALGASEVLYYRRGSAGSRLAATDVDAIAETVRSAQWVHVSGITPALSPSARLAVERVIDLAREGAARVSFDVNLRRKLWSEGEAAATLAPMARRADVVFGDEDELGVVAGGPDAAQRLVDAGVASVIVKLGAGGATAYGPASPPWTEPGLAIANVVDPVGAGDAFCAGFIAARLEGHDQPTALRWGNACGAAVATVEGDMDGAPTRAELDRLLAGSERDTLR